MYRDVVLQLKRKCKNSDVRVHNTWMYKGPVYTRARAHTRSCCTGLFRWRERIRAETTYVTHNSTNSITKFQVIPVPDLSPLAHLVSSLFFPSPVLSIPL